MFSLSYFNNYLHVYFIITVIILVFSYKTFIKYEILAESINSETEI